MAENSNSNSRENARVSVVLSATALQLTSPAGDITELCYRHILDQRTFMTINCNRDCDAVCVKHSQSVSDFYRLSLT